MLEIDDKNKERPVHKGFCFCGAVSFGKVQQITASLDLPEELEDRRKAILAERIGAEMSG